MMKFYLYVFEVVEPCFTSSMTKISSFVKHNYLKNESRELDSVKINARAILDLLFYFGRVGGGVVGSYRNAFYVDCQTVDKVGTQQEH